MTTPPTSHGPVTTKPVDLLANELTLTADKLLRAVTGLSDRQYRFRPASGGWSIMETLEHLAVVETGVYRLISEKLAGMPLTPEQRAGAKAKDSLITTAMFDRSIRRSAPEFVVPTGRWTEPAEIVEVFRSTRERVVAWLADTKLDLRAHGAPHAALGLLDGKQWLLFVSAHTTRHIRQVEEIKDESGFPD